MNNTQRSLLSIYIPITFLILILDYLYAGEHMVKYLKYTTIITLFLSSISVRKRFKEQRIMCLSLGFVIIADFFLVFSTTIDNVKINFLPFGIAGFLFAYICLIIAYHKNFKIGWKEIISGIPIVIIFGAVFIFLKAYVNGIMLIGTLIFGIVLCYMTWTGVCTLYRNYFSLKICRLIAFSSILMFISDMGVAFAVFYPVYSRIFVPWLENIIWVTYIPAWTILAVIINEKNLISNMKNE